MVALTGVMGQYSAGDQAGQEAPRCLHSHAWHLDGDSWRLGSAEPSLSPSEPQAEVASFLHVLAQNLHHITHAAFCWSKWSQASPDSKGRETERLSKNL